MRMNGAIALLSVHSPGLRSWLPIAASAGIAVLLSLSFSRSAYSMRNQSEMVIYWSDESRSDVVGRSLAPCAGGTRMIGSYSDYFDQILEDCSEPPAPVCSETWMCSVANGQTSCFLMSRSCL